jgi:hypothetical protein
MPLDPNISLSYQPPQIEDPLSAIAKVQALRSQQVQGQIGQLQLQSEQMQMQQQQDAIQAFRSSGGDWDKAIQTMYGQGNLLAPRYEQSRLALQKTINENQGLIDKHNADRAARLSNIAAGVLAVKDPAARAIAYEHGRDTAVQMFPELDKAAPPHYTPDMDPQLEAWANAGQTPQERATVASSQAKLPGEQAASAMAVDKAAVYQRVKDLFATNPTAGDPIIDSILPPSLDAGANATAKSELQKAVALGGPDAIDKVLKSASDRAFDIQKALNPAVRQAKVQDMMSAFAGITPLSVQRTVAQEQAVAGQAPEAFRGITDKTARTDAMNQEAAARKEYNDKSAAAEELQKILGLARSGNKAASAPATMAELRMFVNRVNRQEFEAIQGAGSAWDKVQGWVQGKLTGQPIPPDVLNAMDELSKAIQNTVRDKYNRTKNGINQQYGAAIPDIGAYGASGGGTQTHGHYDPNTGTIITH